MNVMTGTVATILDHGVTLAVEVVSSTAWVSGTGVSVQPRTFMWETRILLKPLFFLDLCYWQPKVNFALIALRKRTDLRQRILTLFSNIGSLSKDAQEIYRAGGWQTVSVEGQIVNSFDLVGHRVSAISVPPSAIAKAAIDKMKPNKQGCVPVKP